MLNLFVKDSATRKTKVLALLGSAARCEELADALRESPDFSLDLHAMTPGSHAWRRAVQAHTGVVLVEIDPSCDSHIATLRAAVESHTVIVTAEDLSPTMMRRILPIGVADILPQPFDPVDAAAALRRAGQTAARSRVASPPEPVGTTIAVLGACPGAGATTVAVHLATSLARSLGEDVLLADLDLQFGSVHHALDVHSLSSIADLLDPRQLQPETIRGVAVRLPVGLSVLPAPPDILPVDVMHQPFVAALMRAGARTARVTLLDLPPIWTEATVAALTLADATILVTPTDVTALRHAKRQIATMLAEGVREGPTLLVANRHESPLLGGDARLKSAQEFLARSFDEVIPADAEAVGKAWDLGKSLYELREGAKVRKAIDRLAERVKEVAPAPTPSKG